MGWLWASPPPPKPPTQAPAAEEPCSPAPHPPKPASKPDPESEISNFWAEIQADLAKPKSSTPSTSSSASPSATTTPTAPSSPPTSKPSTTSTLASYLPFLAAKSQNEPKPAEDLPTSTSRNPTPGSEALAHSLRPTEMSCRQAFDLAYACQSMAGQFTSVYRVGHVRSCSHLWDDFWFCMRAKGYNGDMKEEAIRDHYRRKELEKYGGKPNSEDVWASRDEKVAPGTAFKEPFVPDDLSDEEWQLREIERRKQIRRELGIE